MPARSFKISVKNLTELDWTRQDAHLDHGVWTEGMLPPEQIPAGKKGVWEAESDGIGTGTEGHVIYNTSAGTFRFYFNNPYFGSNNYSMDGSTAAGFTQHNSSIDGNNAATD